MSKIVFWEVNNPYIQVEDNSGEKIETHIDTWCATIEGFANDPYCDLPPSWVKKAIDDSNRLRMRIFPNQKH